MEGIERKGKIDEVRACAEVWPGVRHYNTGIAVRTNKITALPILSGARSRSLTSSCLIAYAGNPAVCANLRLVAFPIHPLSQELAVAAHGLGLFPGLALGRFLIGTAQFHFPENAFALHLLLQRF
jgi:hypothetical protein